MFGAERCGQRHLLIAYSKATANHIVDSASRSIATLRWANSAQPCHSIFISRYDLAAEHYQNACRRGALRIQQPQRPDDCPQKCGDYIMLSDSCNWNAPVKNTAGVTAWRSLDCTGSLKPLSPLLQPRTLSSISRFS